MDMVYGNPNYYTQPMYYAPMQPQMMAPVQSQAQTQVQQQKNNSFVWVQGKEAAKAYPVAPGEDVLLMDSDDLYIYMKSADSNGRPQPMKTYKLVEEIDEEEPTNETKEEHMTKEDLSDFVKKEDLSVFATTDDITKLINQIKELNDKLNSYEEDKTKSRRSAK